MHSPAPQRDGEVSAEPFRLRAAEQPFAPAVAAAAEQHGLDPKLLHAVVAVESSEAWLTRAQASLYLERKGIRMKATTLARAYSTGAGGPPCRHVRNKPFYPVDLLEAWAEAQITPPVSSSSERQRLRREARKAERPHDP